MNCILISACLAASAIVILTVFRAAAQCSDIDERMDRDLHDTFPQHSPNPAAESIQEPSATSARR